MEQDDYDPHSLQVLIAHKTRDAQTGCMRLIPPPATDHNFLLPMERFCGDSLTDPVWHPGRLPREYCRADTRRGAGFQMIELRSCPIMGFLFNQAHIPFQAHTTQDGR
jgi:hypothetical protein